MSEQQPINIDRLLIALDRSGSGWNPPVLISDEVRHLQGMCRQAAAGIRQLQNGKPAGDAELMRYLGRILKEVGERLAPDA